MIGPTLKGLLVERPIFTIKGRRLCSFVHISLVLVLPHDFRYIGFSLSLLILGFALGLVPLWGSSHLFLFMLETSPWGLFLCSLSC